eukprot:GHVU01108951.1.p1 GENE.GHVU01108951.1~~GHVU01108951.1.p1  ORF type:complete len:171 (-),score=20.25 GHVU01108951.1:274-786(-)
MTQLSVIGTPMNLSRYIQATGKFQLMYSEEKMVYLLEWKPEAATDNFVIVTMGNYIGERDEGEGHADTSLAKQTLVNPRTGLTSDGNVANSAKERTYRYMFDRRYTRRNYSGVLASANYHSPPAVPPAKRLFPQLLLQGVELSTWPTTILLLHFHFLISVTYSFSFCFSF